MNESNELIPFFFTLIAGVLIGFFIYHITLGKSKTSKQQEELNKNKEELDKNKIELDKYKAQVNDHFNSSAELMGQMADNYQALYKHMASQSQSLLGETATTQFPLLKKSNETDQETEITEPEVNPEEANIVEESVAEVNAEEVDTTTTDIKQEPEAPIAEEKSEENIKKEEVK